MVPDAEPGIIFAISIATKPLPGKPSHRWSESQPIVKCFDDLKQTKDEGEYPHC